MALATLPSSPGPMTRYLFPPVHTNSIIDPCRAFSPLRHRLHASGLPLRQATLLYSTVCTVHPVHSVTSAVGTNSLAIGSASKFFPLLWIPMSIAAMLISSPRSSPNAAPTSSQRLSPGASSSTRQLSAGGNASLTQLNPRGENVALPAAVFLASRGRLALPFAPIVILPSTHSKYSV